MILFDSLVLMCLIFFIAAFSAHLKMKKHSIASGSSLSLLLLLALEVPLASAATISSVSMVGKTSAEPTNSIRGTAYWNNDSDYFLSGINICKCCGKTSRMCGFRLYFDDEFEVKPQQSILFGSMTCGTAYCTDTYMTTWTDERITRVQICEDDTTN